MTNQHTARRGFFSRVAGALAAGLTGVAAQPAAAASEEDSDWPGKLTARHRLVVDAYQINGGRPLDFARAFVETNPPSAGQSVVIFRAGAVAMAVNDAVWAKYKLGESLKITDPATGAPAVKNLFAQPGSGMLHEDSSAITRMLAAGAVMGACNLALHGMSRGMAHAAGVDADQATKDWLAGVLPGITVIPSGVWGLARAQEAGCGYCTGG